jgi:hypothetical protein
VTKIFNELMQAYTAVKHGMGAAASDDPHVVLGVLPGVDRDALDKALKVQLLSIPNTSRWLASLREAETSYYPVDDMVVFEKVHAASFCLNSHVRQAYDTDLLAGPHRSEQLRTTQRAMYDMRSGWVSPERRLPKLRQALHCATTDAETDGLRDELRYLVLEQARGMDDQKWCIDEASRLRHHAPDKEQIAAAAANRDEIEILQAKIDSTTLWREVGKRSTSSLETRRKELCVLLIEQYAAVGGCWFYKPCTSRKPKDTIHPEAAIADFDAELFAVRTAELRADLCNLEAHLLICDEVLQEEKARLEQMRHRLRVLEDAEVGRMRDELRCVLDRLAEQETLRSVDWVAGATNSRSSKRLTSALQICTGFCEEANPLDAYRREKNGDIPQRCMICEFPACEVCKRTSKKPVREEDKQTGAWCGVWMDTGPKPANLADP